MTYSKEIGVIGIGLTLLAIGLLSFLVDIEALKVWVAQSGVWAPLAFILLKMSTIVIAPLSGGALYPLAGLLFNFWTGLLYATVADFLGLTIAFWISRTLGREAVFRITKQKEDGILAKILTYISNAKGFFFACIAFIPMPELLAYASGLTKLRYITFIVILFPLWTIASLILIFIGSRF